MPGTISPSAAADSALPLDAPSTAERCLAAVAAHARTLPGKILQPFLRNFETFLIAGLTGLLLQRFLSSQQNLMMVMINLILSWVKSEHGHIR